MSWHHVAAAVLIFLFLFGRSCEAQAQSDDVLIARVCWSESGPDPVECAAIAHVLAERASLRGVSVRTMARAYAPRATGRESYGARSWVAALHPDRTVEVPGRSDEWIRVRFAALVVVVWHALRGMTDTPCPGALHWSSPYCGSCRRRMRDAGYQVSCRMANVFFEEGN